MEIQGAIPKLTSKISTKDGNTANIVALIENRAAEVGVACLNLKDSEITLIQISDSFTYPNTIAQLQIMNPIEIVLSKKSINTLMYRTIVNSFKNSTIVSVARKYFNETQGLLQIQQHINEDHLEVIENSNYLSLAAAAALIKFVEYAQNITFSRLNVVLQKPEGFVRLDVNTVSGLEIVKNLRDGTRKDTLLEKLNFTKTPMGFRMLRKTLLQPSNDRATLETRLDCVEEFIHNEDLFFAVSKKLPQFLDFESIVMRITQHQKKKTLNNAKNIIQGLMFLKQTLNSLSDMKQILKISKNEVLGTLTKLFESPQISQLLRKINSVLDEELSPSAKKSILRMQQLYCVKKGINCFLDVARDTYEDLLDEIQRLADKYTEEHGMNIKLCHNTRRGYFFSSSQEPPENGIFIQKQKQSNKNWVFSSAEMISLSSRYKELYNEILMISSSIVEDVFVSISTEMEIIYRISEAIAFLDMIYSFAKYIVMHHDGENKVFVRPKFIENGALAIKGGRHPILDDIVENFISNDTFLTKSVNLSMVHGPNMSGKTTYLKQMGLLTVMAHAGCFLPARFASFPLGIDNLVVFLPSNYSSDASLSSSFTWEMKQATSIVRQITPNSVVLVDEMGRGTSPEDALGILWAICEYIITMGSLCCVTTHCDKLKYLENLYPNARSYLLTIKVTEGVLKYNYEVKSSKEIDEQNLIDDSRYCTLILAERIGMPAEVIERAREIRNKAKEEAKLPQFEKGKSELNEILTKFVERVLSLQNSTLDDKSLSKFVGDLKEDYAFLEGQV